MKLAAAEDLARAGRLYPAVIIHGGSREDRQGAALTLARTLLCDVACAAERPCGACRHCRRVTAAGEDGFHPDFQTLERDLKTSTSVEATRALLRTAQSSPFEGRGQVFLVADAETLTDGAANALLKTLEEPPDSAPRHFLLLAPAVADLLPTVRSRSWSLYLGTPPVGRTDAEEELVAELRETLRRFAETRAVLYLIETAACLLRSQDFSDPRAAEPWSVSARCLCRLASDGGLPAGLSGPLLELAQDLLLAQDLRQRGIGAQRILEGFIAQRLTVESAIGA